MSNRSSFVGPDYTPDEFKELFELPPAKVQDAARYQELKAKSNKTPEEVDEQNDLAIALQDYLITAERWNHFSDALTNMQVFIKDEVEGYIYDKQDEFEQHIQKESDRLQDEIDAFDYLEQYSSSKEYVKKNVVSYDDGTGTKMYMAIEDTQGNPPTDTDNWILLTIKGEQGDRGVDGLGLKFKGPWSETDSFDKDDGVQYGGMFFGSLIDDNIGNEPNLQEDTDAWARVMDVGVTVKVLRGQRTISTSSSTVNFIVGELNAFNKNTDSLQVFANSVALEEGMDYEIEDNVRIRKKSGVWSAGTIFYFRSTRNQVNDLIFSDGNSIQDQTIGLSKLKQDATQSMVYIGDSAPSENDYLFWIDTSE